MERHFPTSGLQRLSREIGASEQSHRGQARFVIEPHCPASAIWNRVEPRTHALQWFGELGMWGAKENSGVLVCVSFADRAIEIIADRGIAAEIDQSRWQSICNMIRWHFLDGDRANGLEQGLRETDRLLVQHFPHFQTASTDEPHETAEAVFVLQQQSSDEPYSAAFLRDIEENTGLELERFFHELNEGRYAFMRSFFHTLQQHHLIQSDLPVELVDLFIRQADVLIRRPQLITLYTVAPQKLPQDILGLLLHGLAGEKNE